MDRQEIHSSIDPIERKLDMNDDAAFRNSSFYLKCQLIRVFDGAALALNAFDKIFLKLQRYKSAIVRRLWKSKSKSEPKTLVKTIVDYKNGTSKNSQDPDNCDPFNLDEISNEQLSEPGEPLKAGDLVQVLSLEEITKLLNEKNETKGLAFLPSMYKFCGTKARVRKRLSYIFDERARVMRKIKNVVILEEVICDGEGMFDAESCDRGCFLFWKESWLRKISA